MVKSTNIKKKHFTKAEKAEYNSTNQKDKSVFDVYRLNIKIGEMKMIAENPGFFTDWMTDHNGQLQMALSTEGTDSSVYYRDTEKEEFQKVFTTDFKDEFPPPLIYF